MPEDSFASWFANSSPTLAYGGADTTRPPFPEARPLRDVLGAALAPLLPPGDDPALHVRAEVRHEPGRLVFSLRGLSEEGRLAVDALVGEEG